ncbi:Oidioi.mRNA.OKI2018_I69.chr2.g6907.t1.cds [Oikopleura dioica]|uniref:Oidioi.mRNA.OKI2018_I69.chr2.g6907.t1.cds n=1 Tax=Oikopleura dioica TaxID=34765 RepID=A0ABN7T898_OIKDI|nr:Oidioi.mRNA.OKI2018_I69.chr2.g6907.t1.cds [Oikopleura dioica]
MSEKRFKSIIEHYNSCPIVETIFERIPRGEKLEKLQNLPGYHENSQCFACGKDKLNDQTAIHLHFSFCDSITELLEDPEDLFDEAESLEQEDHDVGVDVAELAEENLMIDSQSAKTDPFPAADDRSSSQNSSDGSQGSIYQPDSKESIESSHDEEMHETTISSVNDTIATISATTSSGQKRDLIPASFITPELMEIWHYSALNARIIMLSSFLPTRLIYGVTNEEIRLIVNWSNNLGSEFQRDKPLRMTNKHVKMALERREQVLGCEKYDDDRKAKVRRLRGITDEDKESILDYIYDHSDESPETKAFECKTSLIIERSIDLYENLKKEKFQMKFGLLFTTNEKVEKVQCTRRLAHSKYNGLWEEFNAVRLSKGQETISLHHFRALIPPMMIEPRHRDTYQCICAPCSNLGNLLSKFSDLLILQKIEKRKLTREEIIEMIYDLKGCKNSIYQDPYIVPLACAEGKCDCNDGEGKVLPLLRERFEEIDVLFRDETPQLERYNIMLMRDVYKRLQPGSEPVLIMKDVHTRLKLSDKQLVEDLSSAFDENSYHYSENRLANLLYGQVRRGEKEFDNTIFFEIDYSGEYTCQGGVKTTQNAEMGTKIELVVHIVVAWGFKMTESGERERVRLDSGLLMEKNKERKFVKSPAVIKTHLLKVLNHIKATQLMTINEDTVGVLLSDNAVEYKSRFSLADIADTDNWGIQMMKAFKITRHGKSFVDGAGSTLKQKMRKIETEGTYIPSIGLEKLIEMLNASPSTTEKGTSFHFSIPGMTPKSGIMWNHETAFTKLMSMPSKKKDGSAIRRGNQQIRMVKYVRIPITKRHFEDEEIKFLVATNICPNLCQVCFSATPEFCASVQNYALSVKRSQFFFN